MTRISVYLFAVAVVFCLAVGALLHWGIGRRSYSPPAQLLPATPSLEEVLNMPSREKLTLNLFATESEKTDSQDAPWVSSVVRAIGATKVRYKVGADRSTQDDVLEADGLHVASSQSYYPVKAGEELKGRHRHVKRVYAPETHALVSEEIRRIEGKLAQNTAVETDGTKHVTDYGEDGVTVVGQQLFVPAEECCGPSIILKKEERWSEKDHKLTYSNVLNDDGTRTITDWDENQRPVKIATWPKGGTTNGATVVAFYPNGHLRLESKTAESLDTANYYRPNKTLSHTVEMSPGTVTISVFDSTGTKLVLKQMWWYRETQAGGSEKSSLYLHNVYLFDHDGHPTRTVEYNHDNGLPSSLTNYDEVYNGVFYKMIFRIFRADGTVSLITFWPEGLGHTMLKSEEHTPEENIRFPIIVPADKLKMAVALNDDLPVPPEMSMHP
jgi:hypothetical protein